MLLLASFGTSRAASSLTLGMSRLARFSTRSAKFYRMIQERAHSRRFCSTNLPLEQRRPDVILLLGGAVLVLEFKSKRRPEQADLDQASAYARDLRAYHRECADHPVSAALVLTGASGRLMSSGGVSVVGVDAIDGLADDLRTEEFAPPISRTAFLDPGAYRPLPTLVEAARELLESGTLRKGSNAPMRRPVQPLTTSRMLRGRLLERTRVISSC